jgi:hypothetical protein
VKRIIGLCIVAIVCVLGAGCSTDTISAAGTPAPSHGSSPDASRHSAGGRPEPAAQATIGPVGTVYTITGQNAASPNGATTTYSVQAVTVDQNAQPDNQIDAAPAGDHLVAVEFSIKGIKGTSSDDADNCAAIQGTNHQSYTTALGGVANGTDFNDGTFSVAPGQIDIGWETFNVPDGVRAAAVQWTPASGLNGSTATWTVSS